MKSILTFVFITILSIHSFGQKVISLTGEFEWSIAPMYDNGSRFPDFHTSYSQFILNIGDKEKIFPVRIDKDIWAVIKMNADGKVIWQTKTAGEIEGIGKFNENILVITIDDYEKNGIVTATMFDAATGRQIQKKDINENLIKNQTEIKVQNKADGSFNDILLRVSGLKNKSYGFGNSLLDDQLASVKTEAVFLDKDLSSKSVELKASVPLDLFGGSLVNNKGNILIAAASGDNLYALEFEKDGTEKAKLSSAFPHRKSTVSCSLFLDETKENGLLISARYSSGRAATAIRIFSFDLKSKKVLTSEEQELDKSYAKSLELEHLKGTFNGHLANIFTMQVVGIIQWKDKICILKEIRSSTAGYSEDAWVLSIYDNSLKHLKTFGLDKFSNSSEYLAGSITWHLKNDRLFVITPCMTGAISYGTLFADVDLDAQKIVNMQLIDKGDIAKTKPIEAGATLWFDNTFLLEYILPVENLYKHFVPHSRLQKVEY